jgi:hypothetical protein
MYEQRGRGGRGRGPPSRGRGGGGARGGGGRAPGGGGAVRKPRADKGAMSGDGGVKKKIRDVARLLENVRPAAAHAAPAPGPLLLLFRRLPTSDPLSHHRRPAAR